MAWRQGSKMGAICGKDQAAWIAPAALGSAYSGAHFSARDAGSVMTPSELELGVQQAEALLENPLIAGLGLKANIIGNELAAR